MAENQYTNKVVLSSGETLIDLTGDTADAAHVLKGSTFHDKSGAPVTGTMPNNGAVTGGISTKAGQYTVPPGYHDGSGKVGITAAEQAKIIPGNIKAGVVILGVTGNYGGESIKAQAKSATPSFSAQTVYTGSGRVQEDKRRVGQADRHDSIEK